MNTFEKEYNDFKYFFSKGLTYFECLDIINGNYDKPLKTFAFFSLYARLPKDQNELESKQHIEYFVEHVKSDLQKSVDEFLSKSTKKNEFILKNLSKPSELGSVKDISSELGLSISYIRELKRDGILDVCYQIFQNTQSNLVPLNFNEDKVCDINKFI